MPVPTLRKPISGTPDQTPATDDLESRNTVTFDPYVPICECGLRGHASGLRQLSARCKGEEDVWRPCLNVFWTIKRDRWRSNCKEIEVPFDSCNSDHGDDEQDREERKGDSKENDSGLQEDGEFHSDLQHHSANMLLPDNLHVRSGSISHSKSPCLTIPTRDLQSQEEEKQHDSFPFMSLPLELRLKIYEYLLPPRTHTIISQYPHNGYYFSPSSNINAFTQTLYPAQPTALTSSSASLARQKENLTTYKILNANFRPDFPHVGIHPQILRTSRAVWAEATPVLYGGATVFDFGVYIDAVEPFFRDRGEGRRFVRSVRVAREIPAVPGGEDALWERTCGYFRAELRALRTVDLTVWREGGREVLPEAEGDADAEVSEEVRRKAVEEVTARRWREWGYVEALTCAKALRRVKITHWGFPGEKGGFAESELRGAFDGWLAKRMVADIMVKERMIMEGCVLEGVVVLPLCGS